MTRHKSARRPTPGLLVYDTRGNARSHVVVAVDTLRERLASGLAQELEKRTAWCGFRRSSMASGMKAAGVEQREDQGVKLLMFAGADLGLEGRGEEERMLG